VAADNPWQWESAFPVGEVADYPAVPALLPQAQCMATGKPVLFSSLDPGTAADIARAFRREFIADLLSGRSFLAVPLLARGNVLGFAVFTRRPECEPFREQDIALAEELAGRTAICIDNARLYGRERRTALTLQSSLLPKELEKPLGLEIASRYLPASDPAGVGGDWFDVIPLSGCRVALVVGDVMGHGVRAAATMGQLRTAARTLASLDLSPAEVLFRLNEMTQSLGPAQITTCVYATYDPVTSDCVLARAGHVPPILLLPDGTTELIDVPTGLPLGIGHEPYEVRKVRLPADGVLALYTDGLVESRLWDIDTGIDAFRSLLSRSRRSLESICAATLSSHETDDDRDDIALLLARVCGLPPDRLARWTLTAGPGATVEAGRLVRETLLDWGLDGAATTGELLVRGLVADVIGSVRGPIEVRVLRGGTLVYEVAAAAVPAPYVLPDEDGEIDHEVVPRLSYRSGTRWTFGGRINWCEQRLVEKAPV
jgi:serine phosphatase RsbU (regulator of sigma subunit)